MIRLIPSLTQLTKLKAQRNGIRRRKEKKMIFAQNGIFEILNDGRLVCLYIEDGLVLSPSASPYNMQTDKSQYRVGEEVYQIDPTHIYEHQIIHIEKTNALSPLSLMTVEVDKQIKEIYFELQETEEEDEIKNIKKEMATFFK